MVAPKTVVLDLDAARAARAENHTARVLRLGGEEFDLPAELPFAFGDGLNQRDAGASLRALLGEDSFTRAIALGLTSEDWSEILKQVPTLYGFEDEGESEASPPSPKRAGKRSKPTSRGTTS